MPAAKKPAAAEAPAQPSTPRTYGLPAVTRDEVLYVTLPDGRKMPLPEYEERLALLSAPFPLDQVEKLPKQLVKAQPGERPQWYRCIEGPEGQRASADGVYCGGRHAYSIHLDYVGHAGVTDRLLAVDPMWSWEPVARDELGLPAGSHGGLWIHLTVLGVTRLGFGDASGKSGPNAIKEMIGDAIRNAAMRFGVATYLWSKSDHAAALRGGLEQEPVEAPAPPRPEPAADARAAARARRATPSPDQVAAAHREVLGAVTAHAVGAERDALLRPLWDRAKAAGLLEAEVDVPEEWREDGDPERCTLNELISGARTVVPHAVYGGPPAQDEAPAEGAWPSEAGQ